ncbi:MAG: glycosyltransferase [bacterium]|nr:glycosyltransferase [bacterium]
MRITLVSSHLVCGGAERAVIQLAEGLYKRKHEIILITPHSNIDEDFYTVPSGVRREMFEPEAFADCAWYDIAGQERRSRSMRESILQTRPDAVVGFTSPIGVRVMSALRSKSTPVVVAERTDIRLLPMNWRWKMLCRWYYPRARKLVVQTPDLKNWIESKGYHRNVAVIPNPVFPLHVDEVEPCKEMTGEYRYIVAMGRLSAEKRFDRLISVFKDVASDFPDWRLIVIGEGPQRSSLENQIDELRIQDRVLLLGEKKTPFPYLKKADIFTLTSEFEGFPNSLLEAMSLGMPSVSMDCPSGPRNIIRDRIDGILVPDGDWETFRESLVELMNSPDLRSTLGSRAVDVLERFHPDGVFDQWEAVLLEAAAGRSRSKS